MISLYIYCAFCYLFVFSVVRNDSNNEIATEKAVAFNTIILAPVTTPILIGYFLSKTNNQ